MFLRITIRKIEGKNKTPLARRAVWGNPHDDEAELHIRRVPAKPWKQK
jgi:hypothetical protein